MPARAQVVLPPTKTTEQLATELHARELEEQWLTLVPSWNEGVRHLFHPPLRGASEYIGLYLKRWIAEPKETLTALTLLQEYQHRAWSSVMRRPEKLEVRWSVLTRSPDYTKKLFSIELDETPLNERRRMGLTRRSVENAILGVRTAAEQLQAPLLRQAYESISYVARNGGRIAVMAGPSEARNIFADMVLSAQAIETFGRRGRAGRDPYGALVRVTSLRLPIFGVRTTSGSLTICWDGLGLVPKDDAPRPA